MSTRSPALSAIFQPGFGVVVATSHETAPAGSKYLASERKISFVTPLRVTVIES
jgi:hypothetical protein